MRQVCVALPTEEDQLLGPTPCDLGAWNTLRTLRGMSDLVRGLDSAKSRVSFSLRSVQYESDPNSSFACVQGGFVDGVNHCRVQRFRIHIIATIKNPRHANTRSMCTIYTIITDLA